MHITYTLYDYNADVQRVKPLKINRVSTHKKDKK